MMEAHVSSTSRRAGFVGRSATGVMREFELTLG